MPSKFAEKIAAGVLPIVVSLGAAGVASAQDPDATPIPLPEAVSRDRDAGSPSENQAYLDYIASFEDGDLGLSGSIPSFLDSLGQSAELTVSLGIGMPGVDDLKVKFSNRQNESLNSRLESEVSNMVEELLRQKGLSSNSVSNFSAIVDSIVTQLIAILAKNPQDIPGSTVVVDVNAMGTSMPVSITISAAGVAFSDNTEYSWSLTGGNWTGDGTTNRTTTMTVGTRSTATSMPESSTGNADNDTTFTTGPRTVTTTAASVPVDDNDTAFSFAPRSGSPVTGNTIELTTPSHIDLSTVEAGYRIELGGRFSLPGEPDTIYRYGALNVDTGNIRFDIYTGGTWQPVSASVSQSIRVYVGVNGTTLIFRPR